MRVEALDQRFADIDVLSAREGAYKTKVPQRA